jgi:GNAT superfamily N-acetyltransferase
MHAFVAVRGERVLGLVHFIYHRNTIMEGPICYLQDLFTVEDARGQGVGRALIEAVYAHAKDSNASRVYWHTHETNHTAMRLYDDVANKPGFVMYRKDI